MFFIVWNCTFAYLIIAVELRKYASFWLILHVIALFSVPLLIKGSRVRVLGVSVFLRGSNSNVWVFFIFEKTMTLVPLTDFCYLPYSTDTSAQALCQILIEFFDLTAYMFFINMCMISAR